MEHRGRSKRSDEDSARQRSDEDSARQRSDEDSARQRSDEDSARQQGDENPARAQDASLRGALRPPGPVRFGVRISDEPGPLRVRIRGEIDVLTTPKLAAELNTLMRRSDEDIIVDLRETEFIDSAGLQLLLGTERRLRSASRRLTVVCDDGPVRRVIEITRLTKILGLMRGDEAAETWR